MNATTCWACLHALALYAERLAATLYTSSGLHLRTVLPLHTLHARLLQGLKVQGEELIQLYAQDTA